LTFGEGRREINRFHNRRQAELRDTSEKKKKKGRKEDKVTQGSCYAH